MIRHSVLLPALACLAFAAMPVSAQRPRTAETRSEAESSRGYVQEYFDLLRQSRRGGESGEAAREQLEEMREQGDPRSNADHPVRDHTEDPAGPNAREELSGVDRWSDGSPPMPRWSGVPNIGAAEASWPWGELYFDRTYPTKLTIENECWTPEKVGIFVYDLPYIDPPEEVIVPARGSREIEIVIETPPEPSPPIAPPTGFPPGFTFGWVKPPAIPSPQPYDPTRPDWHQPNFVEVEGQLVVWHPWTPKPECEAKREVYTVSGHIHFSPPDEGDAPSGPEELFEADPCDVWWLTGERPAQLDLGEEKDCTERIRQLAADFIGRIMLPYIEADPGAWGWLPTAEEIFTMSIQELLYMKALADGQALYAEGDA